MNPLLNALVEYVFFDSGCRLRIFDGQFCRDQAFGCVDDENLREKHYIIAVRFEAFFDHICVLRWCHGDVVVSDCRTDVICLDFSPVSRVESGDVGLVEDLERGEMRHVRYEVGDEWIQV